MTVPIRIALVGDHDASVFAHQAIPRALEFASSVAGVPVAATWLPTPSITTDTDLTDFDAVWCVPASPYRSMAGALRAIRVARECHLPFLGTCGGFQHALLEYARSVLGWADADHAEIAPDATRLVVTPLSCPLVEMQERVRFSPGSQLHSAYGRSEAVEGYHCSYGLNPDMRAALTGGPLREAAIDAQGEVRAVELDGHPFFVATLFQPERAALRNEAPPLVVAFVRAASRT